MSTILFQQAERTLRPNDSFVRPFSLPVGATGLRASFTRPAWPVGVVGRATLTWSNGEKASITLEGFAGETFPQKVAQEAPPGVTDGTLDFQVVQNFASAILVEATP